MNINPEELTTWMTWFGSFKKVTVLESLGDECGRGKFSGIKS
jgi:hypothetical protein